MTLSDRDVRFMNRGRSRARWVPLLSAVLALIWCGVLVWAISSVPPLANPYYVSELLAERGAGHAELNLAAQFCPMIFLLLWFVVCGLILCMLAWTRAEERYLSIVEGLRLESRRARD